MKKLLALLLVLCTLVGLVACGGKKDDPAADNNNPTTSGGSSTDPTGAGASEDPHLTVTPETSPYKGLTLQLYGFGTKEDYTDYSIFGKGNYLWMQKAAIDEWATINGVTIEYKGSYNQAQILAAISSGDKPDMVFTSNKFPAIANVGLADAFTEEEYNKLAAICGEAYLDAVNYKGTSYGFVVPWVGTIMMYYNKTMFENYGVKTPKEYYMEGEWTWENYAKCLEAMTKDLDSDGDIDTYGVGADGFGVSAGPEKFDEAGRLVSRLDETIVQDQIEFKYNMITKGYVKRPGVNNIQKNVTYPMYAMQSSDCEPYNFEHLYQTIPNGDELEVVPRPKWVGDNGETISYSQLTQSNMYILSSCDERAAIVDLMSYILKVGLKYISDYSLGAVKCDYVGMQGKSDLAKTWMENFAQVCADRAVAIKEIENYDEELVAKINEELSKTEIYTYQAISTKGVKLGDYDELTTLPPASSIPAIRAKYEAAIKTYNDTYITAN